MAAELYYTPTSCGAASYIAAHKAGLINKKVNAYEADIRSHKILTGPKAGEDFYKVNHKGNVPTLVLQDGTTLSENAAVLQWIADQAEPGVLAPANGTNARYVLQHVLSYIGTELHAACKPLFNPSLSAEQREGFVKDLNKKLQFVNDELLANNKKYVVGDKFTIADSYLYIVLSWPGYLSVDLSSYSNIINYSKHIGEQSFVKEAHAAMAAASPNH